MKYVAKTLQTITAWKYEADASVPVWVARRCHDLGNGKLTANTIVGPLPIDVGDYVSLVDAEQNAIAVVNGEAFEEEFTPLADTGRRVAKFGRYAVFSPYESCDGTAGWTVQRLSDDDDPDDNPDEFGAQIAEFYDRFDAELFAEAKAEADADARLTKIAE